MNIKNVMESKCFYYELFLKDSQLRGLFRTFCHQLDLSIWGQKMALTKHIFTVSCNKITHMSTFETLLSRLYFPCWCLSLLTQSQRLSPVQRPRPVLMVNLRSVVITLSDCHVSHYLSHHMIHDRPSTLATTTCSP